MTDREKLIAFIEGLTPEQVDKITQRLPLIKQAMSMNESEAIYTQTFTRKMFGYSGDE